VSWRIRPLAAAGGHIQLPGLKWHQISPEPTRDPALAPFTESLDVMGDGSLVLLPTPGHTAGSMSLLVRRTGRPGPGRAARPRPHRRPATARQLTAVAGGRYDRLAEADAAVVARDPGVDKDRETPVLQTADRALEEQQVLEHPA